VVSVRPLRIWLVTVGEPLPGYSSGDRLWRCGFLARLLANRGHQVTWWTSSFDHFNKRYFEEAEANSEISSNLRLQFLKGRPYARNISLARFLNHRELGQRFAAIAQRATQPDVIAASYPPIELCRAVVRYGRERGVPVFTDIRDLWPDEIVRRAPLWSRFAVKLAIWPLRRQAVATMKESAGLIAISDAYLRWGLLMANRSAGRADQMIPLGYTGESTPQRCPDEVLGRFRSLGVDPDRQIFWFCGTFVGNIDLRTVIDAARILAGSPRILFVFSGDGERATEWKRHAHDLANVVFTGWLGAAEIAGMSAIAYAGLAAYEPRASMSLPNKFFEYMSAGLPLVSSLTGEAATIIDENNIGLSYMAGRAEDLAEKILRLSEDTRLRSRQAMCARSLFDKQYSAETIYKRYVSLLESSAAVPVGVSATS